MLAEARRRHPAIEFVARPTPRRCRSPTARSTSRSARSSSTTCRTRSARSAELAPRRRAASRSRCGGPRTRSRSSALPAARGRATSTRRPGRPGRRALHATRDELAALLGGATVDEIRATLARRHARRALGRRPRRHRPHRRPARRGHAASSSRAARARLTAPRRAVPHADRLRAADRPIRVADPLARVVCSTRSLKDCDGLVDVAADVVVELRPAWRSPLLSAW